jgi:hypothetical protein
MAFWDRLIQQQKTRNEQLERIANALGIALGIPEDLVTDVHRIADALETIAAGLPGEPTEGGIGAGIRLGPVLPDPADHGGGAFMDYAQVLQDDQMVLLDFEYPIKDNGGNAIVSTPQDVAPVPDNSEVIKVTKNDGSEPNFPPAGEGAIDPAFPGYWLRGGITNQTQVRTTFQGDDGNPVTIVGGLTVVRSGVAAGIKLGAAQADPNPAS